ncbi:T9SS type A sorting domain-containing protein [Taibaiella lutea]|uniref:T9SS type A sorting domain-containing protein n=1 Tax=Taibaiella lutea TaxID=2608001 RepID=A0A5M6CJ36_9BACT|nr:T9SS type A sorting domain-containing protein [Taibaiella lutea]KAA5534470.1 T9SS type A sorting domain-containing protein [Taibaiella lutea]
MNKKFYFQNLTKRIVLTVIVTVAAITMGFGQISISNSNPQVTNFNGWNGTMPSGWVLGGPSAATTYRGTSATSTGGSYAIPNSGFGYLPSSAASPLTVTATYQNNTGAVITSLRLSYVAYSITSSTRTPAWAVASSLGSVSGLNWAYNSTVTAGSPDSLGIVLTGLNIANGASFTLAFASDRGGGGGSSPMIGMNRVTITNLSTPLFIRLNEFSVVNHGNTNNLSWKTATEESGDRFEIERSINGKNFDKISTMDAKGSAPSVYGFIDQSPVSGTNYYRLKFMNSDGSVFYSNIVSANVSENRELSISAYPNPVTDKLNIAVSGDVSAATEILLLDGSGRTCYKETVTKPGIITINTLQFASGVYFIRYSNGKEQKVIKVKK